MAEALVCPAAPKPSPLPPKPSQSILNKLTPDNFDRLSQQLLDVGITEARTLIGLIAQVGFFWVFPGAWVLGSGVVWAWVFGFMGA